MTIERPPGSLVLATALIGTIALLASYESQGFAQQPDPASQFFQRMWSPDATSTGVALLAADRGNYPKKRTYPAAPVPQRGLDRDSTDHGTLR